MPYLKICHSKIETFINFGVCLFDMGSKIGFEYAGRPFSLEDYANRPLNLFLSPKSYA